VSVAAFSIAEAASPDWWNDPATRIIDPESVADNYAPANLGQLKHVARQAKAYFDARLLGGSGTAVPILVDGFVSGTTPDEIEANYAPLNIGQLKAVAKPFYDRLLELGYDTKAHLIAHGYPPDWAWDYPWNPGTPASENYAPANLGQLKLVFSFEITADSRGSGGNASKGSSMAATPPVVRGGDLPVDRCAIRLGTIEMGEHQALFKSGGETVAYDLPGIPGLEEQGVVLTSGEKLLFGDVPKAEFLAQRRAEDPEEQWTAGIFKNLLGEIVEIKLSGITAAICVDLSSKSRQIRNAVIWKNVSKEEIERLSGAVSKDRKSSDKRSQ
jgi:hypothetical protein